MFTLMPLKLIPKTRAINPEPAFNALLFPLVPVDGFHPAKEMPVRNLHSPRLLPLPFSAFPYQPSLLSPYTLSHPRKCYATAPVPINLRKHKAGNLRAETKLSHRKYVRQQSLILHRISLHTNKASTCPPSRRK